MFCTRTCRIDAIAVRVAACVAAAMVSLASAVLHTANAQTPISRTFISNESAPTPVGYDQLDRVHNGSVGTKAQEFVTEPYEHGITPRKLTLWFDDTSAASVTSSNLTVAIWRSGEQGEPRPRTAPMGGGPWVTFNNPSDLGGGGEKVFTYNGPATLGGDISYHLVIEYNVSDGPSALIVEFARNSDVSEARTGWSLGTFRYGEDGNWEDRSDSPRMTRLRFKLEGILVNVEATGEPEVMGENEVGLIMTASLGDVADPNGVNEDGYEFQWLRYPADSSVSAQIMSGGQPVTGLTYALTDDDLGSRVGVKVVFSDRYDNPEERESGPATGVVVAATYTQFKLYDGDATSGPVVTGIFRVGEEITIDLSGVNDPDDGQPYPLSERYSYVTMYAIDAGSPHPANERGLLEFEGANSVGDFTATYRLAHWWLGKRVTACWHYRSAAAPFTSERNYVCSPLYGPVLPVSGGRPVVDGMPILGETLTALLGSITDPDGVPSESMFVYQWGYSSNGGRTFTSIAGADSRTYTIAPSDVSRKLAVRVMFDDGGNNPETRTSIPFPAGNNTNISSRLPTGALTLVGTFRKGQQLRIDTSTVMDPDGMSNPRWLLSFWRVPASLTLQSLDADNFFLPPGGTRVAHGGNSEFTVPNSGSYGNPGQQKMLGIGVYLDDLNYQHRLHTDFSNTLVGPNREAAGKPEIGGMAQIGETLQAITDPAETTEDISDDDGLPAAETYTYQWERETSTDTWEDIAMATGSSYQLVEADGDKRVRVTVSFIDNLDARESLTSDPFPSSGFIDPNWAATGKPAVSGFASEGHTLMASPGMAPEGIADSNGLTTAAYTYEWYRQDTDGANRSASAIHTGSSYVVAAADVGKRIVVVANFMDDNGNSESRESDPFPPPPNAVADNLPAAGKPEISGNANVAQTLTAVTDPDVTTEDIRDEDGISDPPVYTYSWEREETAGDWQQISGAASSTYLLALADAGKRVRVVVSFTDEMNNRESLTSDPFPSSGNISANYLATGEPAVTGMAEEGLTLNVTSGNIDDVDMLTGAVYTFDWYRQDTDGSNRSASAIHTGDSYRLVAADAGRQIVVVARFMDDNGNAESRESAPYPMDGAVAANVPATGEPSITGIASLGQTLMVTPGIPPNGIADGNGLSGATYTYDWYRQDPDGSNRSGTPLHTGVSYLLVLADVGSQIVVTARFNDDNTNAEQRDSAPYPMGGTISANIPATGTPEISGEASVGETLTAVTDPAVTADDIADVDGLPDPISYTYQWIREDRDGRNQASITGATASAYDLTDDDGGRKIRVSVSFTDNQDGIETRLSEAYPAAGTVSAPPTGLPLIVGTVAIGETLSVDTVDIRDPNGLTSVSYTYQWQRVDADGSNSADLVTTSTYAVDAADLRKRLRVTVSFADDDGNGHTLTSENTPIVNALATGIPTVSGTALVGETLTASAAAIEDDNGITQVTYDFQWQRSDDVTGSVALNISGATSETYEMVKEDEGKFLRVEVSFTDDDGNMETRRSVWSGSVAGRANSAPTGAPTISGTVKAGQDLTADESTISDVNGTSGVAFAFQWQRQDAAGAWTNIGSDTAVYSLTASDVGMRIRVQVSYTDEDGYPESITSDATAPVTSATNTLATGLPAIVGMAKVGRVLQAGPGTIDDADGLASSGYGYQWQRGEPGDVVAWTDIANANSSTYTLVSADEERKIRVKVAFTDDGGSLEELPSEAHPGETELVGPADAPANAGVTGSVFAIEGFSDAITEPAAGTADLVFAITLSRSAEHATASLSVDYTIAGTASEGSDFTVNDYTVRGNGDSSRTLDFGPGVVERLITVAVNSDIVAEPDGETVVVTLTNPTGGASLATSVSATAKVDENEDQISVLAENLQYVSEDRTVSFEISLSAPAPVDGVVEWRVVFDGAGAGAASARSVEDRAAVDCDMENPCTGSAEIQTNGQSPAEPSSAVFDGDLPAGTVFWLQVKPFAATSGRDLPENTVAAVQPMPNIESDEEETVAGGWVVVGKETIATADSIALLYAVADAGRAVAAGIVEGIWRRAEARRGGGMEPQLTLGGRVVDAQAMSSGDAGQAAREVSSLLGIEVTTVNGLPDGLDTGFGGGIEDYRAWAGIPDHDRLASQSSFALPVGEGTDSGTVAFWGEFSTSSREGEPDENSFVETDSSDLLVGLDLTVGGSTLFGLAVSRSSGETTYTDEAANIESATVETSLLTFAPYVHRTTSSGREFWGSFGVGSGTLTRDTDGAMVEADLSLQMLAVGARVNIRQSNESDLSFKVDVFSAQTKADQTTSASGSIAEVSAGATRARAAFVRSSDGLQGSDRALHHRFEVGARIDSGDAGKGAGADVAGTVRYAPPGSGFDMGANVSTLLYHSHSGFKELGIGLSAIFDPGAKGRGASLSLEPTWNAPRSGVAESMWREEQNFDESAFTVTGTAMKARLGYGAETMSERALATLYGEAESGNKDHRLRLGFEIDGLSGPLERLSIDIYGEREERHKSAPSDSVMLEGSLGF